MGRHQLMVSSKLYTSFWELVPNTDWYWQFLVLNWMSSIRLENTPCPLTRVSTITSKFIKKQHKIITNLFSPQTACHGWAFKSFPNTTTLIKDLWLQRHTLKVWHGSCTEHLYMCRRGKWLSFGSCSIVRRTRTKRLEPISVKFKYLTKTLKSFSPEISTNLSLNYDSSCTERWCFYFN